VQDYWAREWVKCEGASVEDAAIEPLLEGGVLVESPDGARRALVRAASMVDGRGAWVEWNRAR
jgi:hypothetical protein